MNPFTALLHDNLTFNFSLAPSNPQQALQSGYLYESSLLQVSCLNLFSRLLKLFYDFVLFLSFSGKRMIFLWNEWVAHVQSGYTYNPQTQHSAYALSSPIMADGWLREYAPILLAIHMQTPFPGVKRQECEADHSPTSSTEAFGNRFNLRTIFKTKHTLRGALMKTGPVRCAADETVCVQHPMWLWQMLHRWNKQSFRSKEKVRVKLSLLQAVKAHRGMRRRGCHVF
jgi:hypothetical protein